MISTLAGRRIAASDLKADANAFTVLRWLLASAVMFSHGWDLTQPARGLDPSVALLSFPVSRLAVFLFFTLSGFLVAGSLVKRGAVEFALARALRLLPGLWTMLLVVPLVLWLVFGTMPLGAFVSDPITRHFLLRNAVLWGGEYRLPGVFPGHPLADVVNGSLWTIPIEVRCYIALGLVGAIGLLMPRLRFTVLFGVAALVHLAVPAELVPQLIYTRWLAFSFFLGVVAWLWRDRVWLSWPLALVVVAGALMAPAGFAGKVAAIQLGFGYLAIVAAFLVPQAVKRLSATIPDYSYGIYIYAFPAQQAAMALGAATPWSNIALGYAMMLPFAAASWHFVEHPALQTKENLARWLRNAGSRNSGSG